MPRCNKGATQHCCYAVCIRAQPASGCHAATPQSTAYLFGRVKRDVLQDALQDCVQAPCPNVVYVCVHLLRHPRNLADGRICRADGAQGFSNRSGGQTMCKQHCSAERSCDHTTRLRDCLHSTACSTCENELHVFRAQQRLLLLDHVALWLSQDFVKVVGTAGTVRRWGSNAAFIWAGQRKSGSPLQLPSLQHSTAQHSTAQHSTARAGPSLT